MMQLSELVEVLNAEWMGADVTFSSVGTDSRSIVAGQLFVALKGEHFDGHDYAEQALAQGAAAVVVQAEAISDLNVALNPTLNPALTPALVVQDTYQALGRMAAHWRSKFTTPIVAVTGSNGKTTVKEMIGAILSEQAGAPEAVHATQGNLNNHIGLPLTLLQLRPKHHYAVLEMGMNHLGEIGYLSHIAKPTVAVISNAGTAHIGELGSREHIAQAKAEIFTGLGKNGVAVVNADDDFASDWLACNKGKKIITFGLKNKADVHAQSIESEGKSTVQLHTPQGDARFTLNVLGAHNVQNALAASAVAVALGVSPRIIAQGLEKFAGVKGRLQRKAGLNGAVLIDDTYNANPDSMRAAIDVLAKQTGEKVLILGDMAELGADAPQLHAQIGEYAKAAGINTLFCLGDLSQNMAQAFGAGAKHYETVEGISTTLKPLLNARTTVLIKGSRFMKMERAVSLLEDNRVETAVGNKKLKNKKSGDL